MNKSILMCLSLLVSFAFNTAVAEVTVTVNKQQYVFAHEPRLVEILAPIANQKNWYWPGAALYQDNDIKLEKMRFSVLDQLSTLAKLYRTEEPGMTQSLEQLQVTIKGWRLARRLPIKIDYDLARIVEAANPRLPKGKYVLDLAPRMNTVQLFGAVNKTGEIPHLAHADISEYITADNRADLADKDYVMLIQADGRKITAPVAYWNKAHQEVMPGSQLFVPFKASLFHPEHTSINLQITTLATNRVR